MKMIGITTQNLTFAELLWLAEVYDFDREVELTPEHQALMDFLCQRAQESTTFTLTQVGEHLGLN